VRVAVRWDYPSYEGIIRQALRHKPDLLIAQSTRHARLARMMLTHTDYKLIEACPCPLLLVKTDRPYEDACVIVAAVDPMHAHAKPAALDRAIVESAGTIAEGLGATLHLYHACAPWPKRLEKSPELWQLPEAVYIQVCAAYEEKAEARVKELARSQNVPQGRVHVRWGDAAEDLPAFASDVSADIVVMGAVSRSRLQRAFLGHTAEHVLDALDCDVMIVKPRDFRSSVSARPVHRLPKGGAPRARYIW
jgi:universal stress protein E